MIAEISLSLALVVGPHPSTPNAGKRSTAALVASVLFLGEGVADCTQTKTRIFRYGTTENNPLTPKIVIQQFHRDHAGLCNTGFFLASTALFFATRRMDQAVPFIPVLIEGANLLQQAHSY